MSDRSSASENSGNGDGENGNDSDTDRDEDSDQEDNEDDQENEHQQPPLYPGAPLSLNESLISILTFSMRHQLSGACVADLLQLIALHCPPGNSCVRTLHNYKKYFSNMGQSVMKMHYYCSKCVYPLREKNGRCDVCGKENNCSYFIEMPIKDQLARLFNREGFYDKLQFRFNRQKIHDDHVEDIYDGALYQEHFNDGGFLSNPDNISFLEYTDGVSVFSTSNVELWPLCYQINELPYKYRVQKQNVILAGIWVSSKKPKPNVFLRPFCRALHDLKENGYPLSVPGQGEKLVKGMLLACTADLPAKATFMRMVAHNGYHGCARCEIQGERYPVGRTTIHVYPFSDLIIHRNHDETRIYADQARQVRQRDPDANVKGVKGYSILYEMVPDFIRSNAIDEMHGCFLGLSKLLVNLWFDSSHSDKDFSLHHVLDLVDSRLSKISPPSSVQRMPRCIKNQLGYWKALEYKMFLMMYSVLVLKDLMEEQYYEHHCQLVSAIYLLSQDSISPDDIQRASELLHIYVMRFQELYGLRWLTLNVHQLLHLSDVVSDLGPLWVYSCFPWEDLNGKLVKLVHGTRYAALQIAKASACIMNLPLIVSQLPAGPVHSYCDYLLNSKRQVKIAEIISNTEQAVGVYSHSPNVPLQLQLLLQASCNLEGGKVSIFYRLKKKGLLYCSLSYERATQKNSSYVSYEAGNSSGLCAVDYFVKWTPCDANCVVDCRQCNAQFLFIGIEYERQQWAVHNFDDVRLSYCSKVQSAGTRIAFPISCITGLCHYVPVDDEEYILSNINRLEVE